MAIVVTAEASDDEMIERIGNHQADRPAEWLVIEAPYDLAAGVDEAPADHIVVVDCVTLWLSNMIVRGDSEGSVAMAISRAVRALDSRESDVIVVSNEVGFGLVPPDPMSRRFRDAQGRLNQALAGYADRSFLVAAGQLLPLADPVDYLPELGES